MKADDHRWVFLGDLEVQQLANATKVYVAMWERFGGPGEPGEEELFARWIELRDALAAEQARREVRRARNARFG